MAARTVYKLLTRAEWEAALQEGIYCGSGHDRRDGFIHLSTAAQLAETARKYFSGVADLVLLTVSVEDLESYALPARMAAPVSPKENKAGVPLLRWEPSRGGDLFPHLYGGLPLCAVTGVTALTLGEDGFPALPDGLSP